MSRYALAAALFAATYCNCAVGADAINMSFDAPLNRPMLVSVKATLDGDVKISAGKFEWEDDFIYSSDIIFVDEHLALGKGVEKATRHYLRHKATRNKEIADSSLNGVLATFEYIKKEKSWDIQLSGDRALSGGLFDQLEAQTTSLGVWVAFPQDARLGGKVTLDLDLLTPLAIDADAAYDSKAKLVLESYDAETGLAILKGPATFAGEREIDEVRTRISSEGTLELQVQVKEQRIAEAQFTGQLELKPAGGRGATVTGKAEHTFTLNTSVKPARVAAAKKRKSPFRQKRIRAPRLGVGVKLPSHWTRLSSDENSRVFVRTVDYSKGEATIDMRFIGGDASYQPGLYLDRLYVALKEDYPDLVQKKTKNPLGKHEGRAYYLPNARGTKDLIQAEVYPFKGKLLMFRLTAVPKAFSAAAKEFQKAKRTLGRLTPRRKK